MCTHTCSVPTKTISITEKAYEALVKEKKNKESFTETILRITKKSNKIADCFGSLKMSDDEEQVIRSELSEGWRITQERISNKLP
jgi:predicted CopG family antitoxin